MTTVVVVEDEASIAHAIAARLRSEGIDVEVAGDGPSAVALVERVRPDLVVLDVLLPGFDGLEVCRRIQRERPVPVLMLGWYPGAGPVPPGSRHRGRAAPALRPGRGARGGG